MLGLAKVRLNSSSFSKLRMLGRPVAIKLIKAGKRKKASVLKFSCEAASDADESGDFLDPLKNFRSQNVCKYVASFAWQSLQDAVRAGEESAEVGGGAFGGESFGSVFDIWSKLNLANSCEKSSSFGGSAFCTERPWRKKMVEWKKFSSYLPF